jgi:hypothetical protein
MKIDDFGVIYYTNDEVCDLIYSNPTTALDGIVLDAPFDFNTAVKKLHANYPVLQGYVYPEGPIEVFDYANQERWKMPNEYKELDIAEWVISLCKSEEELQRVGQELLMYQDRDLFNMLRFMKFFVDTMRKHNLVWGVGRGSSVASYVLFLIGVHRIDSIFYDLPIEEFLK